MRTSEFALSEKVAASLAPPASFVRQDRANQDLSTAVVPPVVHEVIHSPGQPLDSETRAFMEPRFGFNFGNVRVHNDTKSADSAQAVNAQAYTVGQQIVFGANQFAPLSHQGRELLAHELAHTVQQSGQAQGIPQSLALGPANDTYEREADSAAGSILAGGAHSPGAFHAAFATVQRQTTPATGDKKEVKVQPPPVSVPPATEKKIAEKSATEVSTKVGAEVEVSGEETALSGGVKTEIEKEGRALEVGATGKETTKRGEAKGTPSVELSLEGKIPVEALQFRQGVANYTVFKEIAVKGELGLRRDASTIASEMTIPIIVAEIEKNKNSLGLGLSAIGKLEGEFKKGGKPQGTVEVGGELKGEGKFHPGGGPVFLFVEGSVKYTSKSEGGGDFQPGSLTFTTAGGIGVQWK